MNELAEDRHVGDGLKESNDEDSRFVHGRGRVRCLFGGPMTPLDFRLWRVARELSQLEVARLFGVSQQVVSLWEKRKVPRAYVQRVDWQSRFEEIDRQLKEKGNGKQLVG